MLTDTERSNCQGLNPEFYQRVMTKRREEQRRAQAEATQREKDRREKQRQDAARAAQEAVEQEARQRLTSIMTHYREMEISLRHKPVRQIILETAIKHGVSEAEILGRSRAKKIIAARHEAIWRARKERTDMSLPQIGRAFGGLDHTSILFAYRKIEAQRNGD